MTNSPQVEFQRWAQSILDDILFRAARDIEAEGSTSPRMVELAFFVRAVDEGLEMTFQTATGEQVDFTLRRPF